VHATSVVSNTTYLPFGPLTELTFGNGRALTKAYDQDYAIDAVSSSATGGLTLDFGVDVMGNITQASGTLNPATPDRAYDYDPLYRLTTAQTGATPPAPLEAYTYTKTGDRLSASLNGGAAQAYAYAPGSHHLASVGGVARTYDANGNTQTGIASSLTLSYDARNRLSTATKGTMITTYGINGRGERVSKGTSGLGGATVSYVYDESDHLLAEYLGSTVQMLYVWMDDTLVGVVKGGALSYVETDHLGTPRQVIDPIRNVAIWKWDGLASTFGTNTPNQDPDADGAQLVMNLRFPGQYYDAETGLNYNYFRDYEQATGRYIEPDPIGLLGGITTYGYAMSKPLTAKDIFGLSAKCNGNCAEECRVSCGTIPTYPVVLCTKFFVDCHGDWVRTVYRKLFYMNPSTRHFAFVAKFTCEEIDKIVNNTPDIY
jgi:RHS repeat-associated protein